MDRRGAPKTAPRVYAGVGARETPSETLQAIEALAKGLALRGWTLRTGMSPGADQAFYRGALTGGGRVELYLPWPGFEAAALAEEAAVAIQERPSHKAAVAVQERPSDEAMALAERFHPDWAGLGDQERGLRARDVHEILGEGLEDPVGLVVCWTPDGSLDGRTRLAGGTGQALRIAHAHAIDVLNLARPDHMRRVFALSGDST